MEASSPGSGGVDAPAITTKTPEEIQELKEKIKEYEKRKAICQEEIKYWEGEKASDQRDLAVLTGGGDEVRRAELESEGWTREEVEELVQGYENRLQYLQQQALRAEADVATTAAALLHQGAVSTPVSETATPPASQASFETDKQLYSKALDKGSVDVQSSDSVIVGVAGSGKTHSLAMALEEDLPSKRESTPCAKAPVRAVTQTRVGVKESKLSRASSQRYFHMAMRTVKVAAYALRGYTPPLNLAERVDPNTPKYMYALEKEMIERVKNEEITSDLLCEFRWNKVTDSGGQPQFLEVLPIFIHHISLGIITIKLNERLDHHPMIQFYVDGEPLGESYRSCYSHEQIIRYCMRALISQGQGKKDIKLLFLGTHLDLVEDSVGESLEDKNRKLKEMVAFFKLEDNVAYCNSAFDIIYAINAKTPGEKDWKVMKQVREVIAKSSDVPSIRFPIKWYVLELALLRYVQETKQSVLLESECLQLARSFHFDEPNFKAALRYLHQAKLIFYYEKGHLVIADIQFILNKLSEIVCYNIRLCSSSSEPSFLDKMWKRFRYHGILHLSCLDKFPDGYIEGVFSPKELLQLFVYLCIVSEVGPEEYLMPCLLEAEEEASCNPEPESQAVPAMALEFPEGGPMLGSFCGLVCYLMNVEGWKLAEDTTKKPRHLTRSSIHFLVPKGLPGRITINDPLSTFLLVTFHGSLKVASKVCPLVHKAILNALEEVSKTLNYFPQGTSETNRLSNKPHVTFLCPCKDTPLHPAVISDCGEFQSCPYESLLSEESEEVTEKHRVWFGDSQTSVPQTNTSTSGCELVSYVSSLPATARSFLDNQLDWDQEGVATHLNQIADSMIDWEEKLSTLLGLTEVQIHDLKEKHLQKPVLLRRAALRVWQDQQGLKATYRNLLRLCCEGEHSCSAEIICRLLREKATEALEAVAAQVQSKSSSSMSQAEPAVFPETTFTEIAPPTTTRTVLPEAPAIQSHPSQLQGTREAVDLKGTPSLQSQATPSTITPTEVTSQLQPQTTSPSHSQATPLTVTPTETTPQSQPSPSQSQASPSALPTVTSTDATSPSQPQPTPPSRSQDTLPSQTTPPKPAMASPCDPSSWSVEDVCSWLTSQDLLKFVEVFRENEVDGECLLTINHELLKDGLGITALGQRSKILQKIKDLKK